MFTGIITDICTVKSLKDSAAGRRLHLATGDMPLTDVAAGDSIAVNGCCLTVLQADADGISADISHATLACTTLGDLQPGARVNLEKAMLVGDRLSGHFVTGHVDAVCELMEREEDGDNRLLRFHTPATVARYIAPKGSVSLDGVSLTVNEVDADSFTVNLIPYTRCATTLDERRPGQKVNIEADLIARYLDRMAPTCN